MKGNIIDSLSQLSERMQQQWNCEEFFASFLKIFGTASSSIKRALNDDKAINVASHELGEKQLRTDLAIPNRVYFRFLKRDEDVRNAVDEVRALSEFRNQKFKLQYIVCCSAHLISVYDTAADEADSFSLQKLAEHCSIFLPLTGEYAQTKIKAGTEADARACRKLTHLLNDLISLNQIEAHQSHHIHEFIRRVLFCLFAEDTGIFQANQFTQAFQKLTDKRCSNAKQFFTDLFQVLDCPEDKRAGIGRPIAKEILAFPYVNGGLFREEIYVPEFDLGTRDQLLNCGVLHWHEISPAIFGAMFQNALDPDFRRTMGAHYTSEENILKIINPLFMDELNAEFERLAADFDQAAADADRKNVKSTSELKKSQKQLMEFQDKLASLKFLDPACGCGNFLIIAYRELRRLENKVLDKLFTTGFTNVADAIKVNIDQFYGIEIEDWPAEIAHVSMWLMQHVMNEETAKKFGVAIPTLPLKKSAVIKRCNALTTDWNEVLPASECSFILGNPPFGGAVTISKEQKEWLKSCYPAKYKINRADFCTGWYVKAADYMKGNRRIEAAFVSTNSICQGQQTATLWGLLLKEGISINFAYKSFPWKNASNDAAAVTCVIVGFSYLARYAKTIFSVDANQRLNAEHTSNISAYLLPISTNVIVAPHNRALSAPLNLNFGNMPIDGGNLILSAEEGKTLLTEHPETAPFIKYFKGSEELMKSSWRYCFYLLTQDRAQWEQIPVIMQHVAACRAYREAAPKSGDAYKLKDKPWSFREQFNPPSALVIPRVSSERRYYVPMDFIDDKTIINDRCFILPNAETFHFGILTSRLHMCWMKLTCGRLKSDYNYSRDLVYNTFIWPAVTPEQKQEIAALAEDCLLVREDHFEMTLAELYNPETMPAALKQAHEKLDLAVERLYREKPFISDEERTMFMLNLYAKAAAKEQSAK